MGLSLDITCVLIRRGPCGHVGHRTQEKHTDRRPCDHRGRDWSDPSTSQGMPRNARNLRKLEETRKGYPLGPLEGTWPGHT